ncbi:MAG: hypothetical protein Q9175_006767 [Cornicularia normoerica]
MDYSYFAPPAQPYQFFGIAPAKPELPYTPHEEPQNDPLDVYDPNTFQFFDYNAHFNSTALIPSTLSPAVSIHPTDSLPNPRSIAYDRSLSQDLIGDVDFDQAPGRGSSDDDKDNLTPAQSRRKAQNRAAQRAFRERKERHVKDLELKLKSMDAHSTDLLTEIERLKRELDRVATQNEILRADTTSRRAPHREYSHNAHHEGSSSPDGLTSGPMIYSPSTFNAAFAEHHTSGPEEPISHRIEISATTGERLLATGAAWDFIQHHELYRRGLVDIVDVSEKLKEKVVCDGAGPTFSERDVIQAIEDSVGGAGDELI